MLFHITMEKADPNWIVVECPALPGCVSQGSSEEEAITNIREAITAWLWAADKIALQSIPAERSRILVAI